MKTTNNVQKAVLKSLAVVVSLVLISFTVSAQGFWESLLENTTFNEIALAMVESNSESNMVSTNAGSSSEASALAAFLEEEAEEAMELEDWMTNESNFATATFVMEEAVESPLEIEEWMTDADNFSVSTLSLDIATEESLEIEGWMVNNKYFEVNPENNETDLSKYTVGRDFIFVNLEDQELKLEAWMTDEKVWRN